MNKIQDVGLFVFLKICVFISKLYNRINTLREILTCAFKCLFKLDSFPAVFCHSLLPTSIILKLIAKDSYPDS